MSKKTRPEPEPDHLWDYPEEPVWPVIEFSRHLHRKINSWAAIVVIILIPLVAIIFYYNNNMLGSGISSIVYSIDTTGRVSDVVLHPDDPGYILQKTD